MKALCGYVVPEMLHIMTVYAALSVYVGLRIHVLPPSRNIIKDLKDLNFRNNSEGK
jgi:hypothetical protein